MNDLDNVKYQNLFKCVSYGEHKPTAGEAKSGSYKQIRDRLDADVDRVFLLSIQSENETDGLDGQGLKVFIPSNNIDIYTRLKLLLELELSDHTDSLTEVSKLKDELYGEGETQNENNIELLLTFSYYLNGTT